MGVLYQIFLIYFGFILLFCYFLVKLLKIRGRFSTNYIFQNLENRKVRC